MLMLMLDRVLPFPLFYLFYIFLQFFIFLKKNLKILKIPIFILSFIDNGFFVAQDISLIVSNSHLFYSNHIMFLLLEQFRLVTEYGKMEVFYFYRLHRPFNPPPLNLMTLEGSILHPKKT